MTAAHSTVCEWSTTPNSRCRCACQGRQHGIQAVRARLLADQAERRVLAKLDKQAEETSNDQ